MASSRAHRMSFNPRPRTGGDTRWRANTWPSWKFQSTPPHRRRRCADQPLRVLSGGFNPRPRTGGDGVAGPGNNQATRVSIHAPAQEATQRRDGGQPRRRFQSTPPHRRRPDRSCGTASSSPRFNPRPRTGGDRRSSRPAGPCSSFNPRPRTGGDGEHHRGPRGLPVSIHAPAQEATYEPILYVGRNRFQSTPPHRRRPTADRKRGARAWFQSTPPHRRRPRPSNRRSTSRSFNPRPRTGGDPGRARGA